MIIDYKANSAHAIRFDIRDAVTGESLMKECIFWADDEAGVYRRHLGGVTGKYVWDRRTHERISGRFWKNEAEHEDLTANAEVAWEEVRRPFVLVERDGGYVTPKRINFREFT